MFGTSINRKMRNVDSSIIYYDARFMSNFLTGKAPTTTNPGNSFAIFEDQRQSAILRNPEEYYLTIARFTVDTSTMPLFVMNVSNSIQFPGTPDNNLTDTPFIITMEYGGFEFKSSIQYTPEDKSARVPDVERDINEYNTSEYFFVYTYQHLVDMVNTCFKACFDGLAAQVALPTTYAPFMVFDRNDVSFDIVVDGDGFRNKNYDGTDNAQINVYFNNYLYDMFFNVQADHLDNAYAITPSQNLKDFLLRFENNGYNVYDNSTDIKYYDPYNKGVIAKYADNVITMRCEWDVTTNICENAELLFSTSQVPTSVQYTSPYIPFEDNAQRSIINTFQKQLTDFSAVSSVDSSNSTRNVLVYTPNLYRYIELEGDTPLTRIDIFVYWRTNRGALIPLNFSTKSLITLKFMFVHKKLFSEKQGIEI